MIRICLCDDEQEWIDIISSFVHDYFSRHENMDYTLTCFPDAMSLLDYIEKKGGFDICLLDVYMPLMLGTDLAREMRDKGDESRIAFLTTSKFHAIDAFSVRASDYILKPFEQDRIDKLFDELISQFAVDEHRLFTVRTREGFVNIKYNTIVYIELVSRRLFVHTVDGEIIESLIIKSKFEEELSVLIKEESFIHCQKSFVVNAKYVSRMENLQFVMESGDIVPISKRMYQDTKRQYVDYLLRKEI